LGRSIFGQSNQAATKRKFEFSKITIIFAILSTFSHFCFEMSSCSSNYGKIWQNHFFFELVYSRTEDDFYSFLNNFWSTKKKYFFAQFPSQNRFYNYRMTWTVKFGFIFIIPTVLLLYDCSIKGENLLTENCTNIFNLMGIPNTNHAT
jgi:hypothetical protein